jgi:ADP-ribose pyrophosphatase YjhB (NUDIX family)
MPEKQAAVVLVKTGPLVLVSRNPKYGGIALPGGKVEEGESIISAAIRELEEETGVLCHPENLCPILKVPSSVEADRMVTILHAYAVLGSILHARKPGDGPAYFTTWQTLLEDSPFKALYRKHFPIGIRYLANTLLSFG